MTTNKCYVPSIKGIPEFKIGGVVQFCYMDNSMENHVISKAAISEVNTTYSFPELIVAVFHIKKLKN